MALPGTGNDPNENGVEGFDNIDLDALFSSPSSEGKAATEPTQPSGEEKKVQPVQAEPAKPAPVEKTPPVQVPPTPPTVPTPVAQPQAPVQPQAQPPVVPQPVVQPQPAPQPVPGQVQPPVPSPMEAYQQKRGQIAADVAKRYTVSPEDATRILTEPDKYFPEMIGRLFVDIYEAVYATVHSQLPGVISHLNKQQEGVNETKKEFYGLWPSLNKPEYESVIRQVAQAYYQTNPKATKEEAFKAIGAIASYNLGIGFQPVAPPAAPSPVQRPPMPAGVGAASTPAVPGTGRSFFEDLAREFEEIGNKD